MASCNTGASGKLLINQLSIYPLRRLQDIGEGWVKSLEANNAEAKESRIRAILADAGPKCSCFARSSNGARNTTRLSGAAAYGV
jgi:hypothetical protein